MGPEENPPATHRFHPVSVPGFSGPLDLLLALIEEGKMDISRLSLAAVTAQYLERVRQMADLPPEHLADFLVVAATLLLLKSKQLLPALSLTDEEEERVVSLEEQLQEYRKFRAVARAFLRQWAEQRVLIPREGYVGVAVVFAPPPGLGMGELRAALDTVLTHLPRLEILPQEIIERVVSLEERIRDIQERVTRQSALTFREVAMAAGSRLEVIVSFLALLELVKQRLVAAEQAGAFRDILVKPVTQPTEQRAGETADTLLSGDSGG